MFCPKCGKKIPDNSVFCASCGSKLTEREAAKKTGFGRMAGSLDIISGSLGLVGVLVMVIAIVAVASDPFRHEPFEVDPLVILGIIAGALAVPAVLAIVGGVYAVGRKKWMMAIIGAIAATFTFFPIGIPAVVLTALARDEFE